MFAGTHVRRELRTFERRGLNRHQRQLSRLVGDDLGGKSMLEIGCGCGTLTTTLLPGGAAIGSYVEISVDYLEAARYLVRKAGVTAKADFHLQDFASPEVSSTRASCYLPEGDAPVSESRIRT